MNAETPRYTLHGQKRYYTFYEVDGRLVYFEGADCSSIHQEMCLGGRGRLLRAGAWQTDREFGRCVRELEAEQKTGE